MSTFSMGGVYRSPRLEYFCFIKCKRDHLVCVPEKTENPEKQGRIASDTGAGDRGAGPSGDSCRPSAMVAH